MSINRFSTAQIHAGGRRGQHQPPVGFVDALGGAVGTEVESGIPCIDAVEKIVVENDRGNGCKETESRGDQGFRNSRCHCDQTGRLGDSDFIEGVHDAPDSPKKADEGGDTSRCRQKVHHFFQPGDFPAGCLDKGSVDRLQVCGRERYRIVGFHVVGHHFEARTKKQSLRTGFIFRRRLVDFEQIPAFAEHIQKFFGLGRGYFQRVPLEKDDGPGKDGKEKKNEEHQFHDEAGIDDKS